PSMSSEIGERSTASPLSNDTMPSIAAWTLGGGSASSAKSHRARNRARVVSSDAVGSWTAAMPRSAQAIPQRPMAVSNSASPGLTTQLSSSCVLGDVTATRPDGQVGLLHAHFQVVDLAVELRRREGQQVLTMQLVGNPREGCAKVVDALELVISA